MRVVPYDVLEDEAVHADVIARCGNARNMIIRRSRDNPTNAVRRKAVAAARPLRRETRDDGEAAQCTLIPREGRPAATLMAVMDCNAIHRRKPFGRGKQYVLIFVSVPIFDQLPSGERLTPDGELVLQHIRGNLRDLDEQRAEMDGSQGIRGGHVPRHRPVQQKLVSRLPHPTLACSV